MFILLHHDGIRIEDILTLHYLFYQKIDIQNAGHGRTARLMMNVTFIQNGYPPCAISPQLRLEYLQALDEAHDVQGRKGKPEKFISFVAEMETETENSK